MVRSYVRRAAPVAAALALLAPALLSAQTATADRYLNHQELTQALRSLADRHRNLVSLTSLAKTDAGRDIWLLTIGNRQGRPVDTRSALLIVTNLEGNYLIGGATAVHFAEQLVTRHAQDTAVRRLLDERTIYVIPRANPDGAELAFSMRGYEIPYKPFRGDAARGGLSVRELGADLNGDGLVTVMRVRDPEGDMIPDPADPRAMRRADRTRAERGLYKVMVEGIDPASLDAYVPMGSDGVDLNRNFQHEYLYYRPHTGPHMVSEVETRTLADFVHDRHNISAVLTWSPYDNLRALPPVNRQVPQGVQGNPPAVPTNLLPADRPFFDHVSSRFHDLTGMRGSGADNEAGSFAQFAYFQLGLPSFTTPIWTLPPAPGGTGGPQGGGGAAAPAGGAPPTAGGPPGAGQTGAAGGAAAQTPAQSRATQSLDVRWLALFREQGIDGFVDWTPARHPTLGQVEVGGFRPNSRVNPPPAQIRELADKHGAFALWLAQQLPDVQVETTVEARGDNVWLVTATLANESYLPTQLAMGTRTRGNRPITVRLMPLRGMTVLTGNIQQQIPRLDGMGGRSKHTWLVQAPPGTRVTMEVFAERAGGLQSIPLTLR